MIWIKEHIPGNIYIKAKAECEPYKYKKGDVIWKSIYSHEEMRYIRVPWWEVVRVYKAQNLILKPYGKTDYVNNFMK